MILTIRNKSRSKVNLGSKIGTILPEKTYRLSVTVDELEQLANRLAILADDWTVSGGRIDQWNDASGNARHVTQTGTARFEETASAFGALPGARRVWLAPGLCSRRPARL